MNKFYTDKELESLFGRRPIGGIALFEPLELGWICPKSFGHYITWSEFKDHVWCYQCEMDYFTLLCPKEMNPYTTPLVLEEEIESVAFRVAEWSLYRYRTFGEFIDICPCKGWR